MTRETVAPALLDRLAQVGVCTATAILQRLGFRNTFMIGVQPLALRHDQVMVGRARTLRFIPLREDLVSAQYASLTGSPHRQAIEAIAEGEVLVMDARGSAEAAVLGDIFTRRLKYRGASGVVMDGVVRDVGMIRSVGLPVYGRGVHGASIPRALMSVGMDETISCGGVAVMPGDILLGDDSGVVVIPPHVAEQVAEEGIQHEQEEEYIRLQVEAGASLHTVYRFPMSEEVRREYEAWLERGKPGR